VLVGASRPQNRAKKWEAALAITATFIQFAPEHHSVGFTGRLLCTS